MLRASVTLANTSLLLIDRPGLCTACKLGCYIIVCVVQARIAHKASTKASAISFRSCCALDPPNILSQPHLYTSTITSDFSTPRLIMSDDRKGNQPSRSPGQATYDWYMTARFQSLSIQTYSNRPMPYQPRTQTMPEPEHSQYLNTQSMKVNAGLDFGRANNETKGLVKATSPDSILDSNAPVLNIDFRDLRVPAQIPIPIPPMAEELIPTLLHPPPHAFLHGVLSMQWVMGALGQCHFHFRSNDERYVLAPDSTVRTEGAHLGLPPVYLEWLCGDEEESSPTEQGMHLTPRFFEELREGKGDK
ncbi:hypothetical protein M3J07_011634 [Ascochyta lentis]